MCVQFLEMFLGCWMVDFSHNKNKRERKRERDIESPWIFSNRYGFDSAISGPFPLLVGFWDCWVFGKVPKVTDTFEHVIFQDMDRYEIMMTTNYILMIP